MTMKTVFQATDGSDHATKTAAKRRDDLRRASEELETAIKKVERILASRALTADGERFDLTKWRSYWLVLPWFSLTPCLQEVSLYPHNLSVDFDRGDGDLVVRWFDHNQRGGGQYRSYKVSELYADKKKAQAALAKACEERLAELAKMVEELKTDAK